MLNNNSIYIKIYFVLYFIICTQISNAQSIPLSAEHWKVVDNENNQELDLQVTNYKGKKAIHLGRHEIATVKDGTYENFVLEMDIAGKAMPGIAFRAKDLWNYEFLYLRVFSGGKDDAIQYIPVFNGSHPWQLYNQPVYETTGEFKPQEWIHLKIEVFGKNMRVFVGDKKEPNMGVKLLQNEVDKGAVFLKTSFAEAYFSNIEITPLEKPFQIKPVKSNYTYLTQWNISEQVDGNIHSQSQYFRWLDDAEKNHKWQTIEADKTGIVNLAKYYKKPEKAVFAKTKIL